MRTSVTRRLLVLGAAIASCLAVSVSAPQASATPSSSDREGPSAQADVTLAELQAIYPDRLSDPTGVEAGLPSLNAAMNAGEITTPARKAAFLATLLNESELLYFADQASGDTYTGRGYIQLTGDFNYEAAGSFFGIDLLGDPALALSIDYSAPIAEWYWNVNRDINPLADALDMGAVDDAIGYAEDPDEDVQRCDDFKAALAYYNGGTLPDGINCVRPLSPAQQLRAERRADGIPQEPAR